MEKELETNLMTLYRCLPELITEHIYPWVDLSQKEENVMGTGDSGYRKNICGDVHDDNAFFWGGMQPHAGLFGSLSSLTEFTKLWMTDNGILTRKTQDLFHSVST
ncbi:MAG: hypothetical protein R3A45_07590 [Bdellovibrionota bacterium]